MTPEDKETAMQEAVEAMCRVDWARIHPFPHVPKSWDEEHEETKAMYRDNNRSLLRALLEPRVTGCETCGGTHDCVREVASPVGGDPYETRVGDCPDCDEDGKVTRPSLAVQVLIERGELARCLDCGADQIGAGA